MSECSRLGGAAPAVDSGRHSRGKPHLLFLLRVISVCLVQRRDSRSLITGLRSEPNSLRDKDTNSSSTPAALKRLFVVRRECLIPVNYEAWAAGVTRHMRAADAKKVCPGIHLVHVQTIDDGVDVASASIGEDVEHQHQHPQHEDVGGSSSSIYIYIERKKIPYKRACGGHQSVVRCLDL